MAIFILTMNPHLCGRFVGFRVLPCGLGVVANAELALGVAVVGSEEGNDAGTVVLLYLRD